MRKSILFVLLALTVMHTSAQNQADDKNRRYFDINKNIDIFNSVLRELDMFYVDSIEVDKLIQGTIVNMLARLDPYTEYYPEESMGGT